MRRASWPFCSLVCLTWTVAPEAQSTARGMVRGKVVDARDTTTGLPQASVSLQGALLDAQTDARGHFAFRAVPYGTLAIRVRALGFDAWDGVVTLSSDTSDVATIALKAVTQRLSTIAVEGRQLEYPASFEEQYRRAARGGGYYFTREMIDSLQTSYMKSLLALLPTVLVSDRGITFQKCQSGLTGLNAPGATLTPTRSERREAPRRPGNVAVYVDGVRMTRPASNPDDADDADRVLRTILPATIQIVEIYTGTARIPGEFLADACAVIAVWTRRH